MITYVNTVLVSNAATAAVVASESDIKAENAGKFVILNCDDNVAAADMYINSTAKAAAAKTIKIGLITSKTVQQINPHTGAATTKPVIKWSNIIKAADVKGLHALSYAANTEDTITIDFTNLNSAVKTLFANGGKRIIVRLTFKDTPTRYRKWTESYEYVTLPGDTETSIATNITNLINKEYKRARVVASNATAKKIVLTAMPYDDDDSIDTINVANKVRFNVNLYYTDPAAEGWESKNKLYPTGVTITKTPGEEYPADAKLVRDREAQAMGYQGILNRGEGTWPIIKPAMETVLTNHYNALTLEFENMYRAADDIFRKTKQTLEVYCVGATTTLKSYLDAFIAQEDSTASAAGGGSHS